MKFIFLTIVCLLSVSKAVSQNQVIDVKELLGKGKYNAPSMTQTKDGSMLVGFDSELILINPQGKIVHRAINPITAKKYKYDLDQAQGYNQQNDVFFLLMDGNYVFVKNYSSEKPEVVEVGVPKLENLRGSVYKYDDKKADFNYYSSKPAISTNINFLNDDNVLIARSYVSMSKNSHESEAPKKDKYNSFVRLTYINLKSMEINEEYVMKDVFKINRDNDTEALIEILGFENDEFKIGVSNFNKKLIHPQIRGYKYSGDYEMYTYNIKTKETKNIGKITIEPVQNSVYSSIETTKNALSVSWTEHIENSDKYALKRKTYRILDSGEVETTDYVFPVDVVSLLQPQVFGVFDYENLKGDKYCVLAGDFVKNKRGKDPVPAYVLINKEQNADVFDRSEEGLGYFDAGKDAYYQFDIEFQDQQELIAKLSKPLAEKGLNVYDLRKNCSITQVGNKKFIAVKYFMEFKTGFGNAAAPATFLMQFIEIEL
ncbi:hypothetical protein [Fluviicola taffensis]|uniref:Uncharacterized protein n=1 Tax=Fluviicola taffensis (strain DSM 16823 / NCIMB 13979 / RW262) TaxID=755732 RepID=F2IBF4_FLUTR|nr:hypothetical protein [Fluviicola taffensis]AEA44262.1 hypothetical protein Fluta_2276 [Fluviicola taffensis DSM 16823]